MSNNSRSLNVLVGGVALVVLAVAVYLVARTLLQPPLNPSVAEGQAAAQAFIKQLSEGKAGDAWDSSSTEFKSIEGRESFVRKVKSNPLLAEPVEFASTQDVNVNDTERTEFLFTTMKSGKTVRLLLANEANGWKVDRLTF